jgi:hypothetical protein
MKWKIDDDYTIETDWYSFSLKKDKIGDINPKTGKPMHTKGQWWFPTIEKCLDWYKQDMLICSKETENVISLLEKIKTTIEGFKAPKLAQIKSEALLAKSNSEVPLMA